MSSNVQNFLLKAALAGLVAVSIGCGSEPAKHDEHGEHAGKHKAGKHDATPVSAAVPAEQPAAGATHTCKGLNACKGQGGCKVAGVNECAGKNECKGKGGCSSAMAATTPAAVDPAAQPAAGATHACKGMNECKGQGGCNVDGQNTCKGQNPCKGKGGCKTS